MTKHFRIALLACAAAWAGDAQWPQFRGPDASGLGTGSPVTEWNGGTGKNILWKTAIPGLGHSSPVICGDRIFVTTAVPAQGDPALKLGMYGNVDSVEREPAQSFRLYCLDRKSGKVLWERTAASGPPKSKRHPKSSHANPSPATDGRHVAAFFGSEGLYVYDFDGRLLWKKDFGVLEASFFVMPEAQWGFASSPVIAQGKLVVLADVLKNGFLAAFDVRSGRQLWRTPRADVPTFGTPTVAPYAGGSRQIVVNGWKHIGGYDLETGKELWKMKGGGDIPTPTPVFSDGLVVITSAHGQGRPIYAVRTNVAADLAWAQERAGNYIPTPLLHDGLAYFCGDLGVLTVYALNNGERLYQQRLGGGRSAFSSSPVAAAGRLYTTDEDGRTYVLALGRAYRLLAENELGENVMASAAVVDGVLYIRGRHHLFAIGAR
ncbi:MAG: PQQ-binding-like beta-propeller repeat protein [Bryobacteraceae bacterium]